MMLHPLFDLSFWLNWICIHFSCRDMEINFIANCLWQLVQNQMHLIVTNLATRWRHLHCHIACDCLIRHHQLVFSWHLHQTGSNQSNQQQKLCLWLTFRFKDQTPGIPGSDKNQILISMICTLLSQIWFVKIYAVLPAIVVDWKVDFTNFFAFEKLTQGQLWKLAMERWSVMRWRLLHEW